MVNTMWTLCMLRMVSIISCYGVHLTGRKVFRQHWKDEKVANFKPGSFFISFSNDRTCSTVSRNIVQLLSSCEKESRMANHALPLAFGIRCSHTCCHSNGVMQKSPKVSPRSDSKSWLMWDMKRSSWPFLSIKSSAASTSLLWWAPLPKGPLEKLQRRLPFNKTALRPASETARRKSFQRGCEPSGSA